MSDWSSDVAQRIRQKQHREQIENQRAVREERLLWEKAPRLRDKLRKTLIDKCVEFNAEEGIRNPLVWSREDPPALSIGISGQHRYISLSFDSQPHSVSTRDAGATRDCYRIAVVPGTCDVSFMDASKSLLTVDQIAQKILCDLLGIA